MKCFLVIISYLTNHGEAKPFELSLSKSLYYKILDERNQLLMLFKSLYRINPGLSGIK